MGSMVTYTRPDGQSATGYLVQPAAGSATQPAKTSVVRCSSSKPQAHPK